MLRSIPVVLLLLAVPADAVRCQTTEPPAGTTQQGLWTAGYDGGFYLRSPDRRTEVVLEGLIQVGGNWFQPDRGRTSGFDLRRVRPELSGDFGGWLFKLEPKFTEDEVELEEAWIGADLSGGAHRLMLGRMKAPFSLEEVRSRRHIHFPRFSILNQFVPAEDHGAFLNGRLGDTEYGLAVYNGTGGADTESSADVAGRLMLHPWTDRDESPWRNLGFGFAATWGRQDADVQGDTIDNETGSALMTFAPGARLDGDRGRLGFDLEWWRGPWMLQAELFAMRQEMRQGALQDRVQFHGGYVDVALVLTGEDISFKGVKARSPVNPGTFTGTGAWVLALRYSELRSDRSLSDLGLVLPAGFTDTVRTASLGLNWVLNDHVLVRHAYVHSFYGDDVLLGGNLHGDEGALMIEWQVHF